jgi:hypothetical protein
MARIQKVHVGKVFVLFYDKLYLQGISPILECFLNLPSDNKKILDNITREPGAHYRVSSVPSITMKVPINDADNTVQQLLITK